MTQELGPQANQRGFTPWDRPVLPAIHPRDPTSFSVLTTTRAPGASELPRYNCFLAARTARKRRRSNKKPRMDTPMGSNNVRFPPSLSVVRTEATARTSRMIGKL